jgi:hypothetical protein
LHEFQPVVFSQGRTGKTLLQLTIHYTPEKMIFQTILLLQSCINGRNLLRFFYSFLLLSSKK